MELQSVTLSHNGRPIVIDVLERPAKSAAPVCHVVVLPGNPSVLPFYEEFTNRLADGLHGVSVHAVGHAGFSFEDHNNGEAFDLDDQIELKILYLERLLAKSPTRLILIGHSVGAFMVMEIMKRRPDFPIDNAAFLFPALCDFDVAWPIHIMKYPSVYEPLAFLVSYLPDRWKSLLVSAIPKVQHEASMIARHCNAHTVRNGFALVRHELQLIRELQQTSIDLLNGFGHNLLFLFTRFDQYVPLPLARRIQAIIPKAVHVLFDDHLEVQHAFVLKDSARVADTALEYLIGRAPHLSPPSHPNC